MTAAVTNRCGHVDPFGVLGRCTRTSCHSGYCTFESKGGTGVIADVPKNMLTVGLRSDGQISIASAPDVSGPAQVQSFIMPADAARWLAHQLLRLLDQRPAHPNDNREGSE